MQKIRDGFVIDRHFSSVVICRIRFCIGLVKIIKAVQGVLCKFWNIALKKFQNLDKKHVRLLQVDILFEDIHIHYDGNKFNRSRCHENDYYS